ncbi:methyltransferase domain-containing protein [archaeon]|nr:methyltransferase domain-containing protein [archaeon]NDB54407.1 methyltransferase domain-containing protein [archaeon]NDB78333.1 methyltransferase domain-containing protein [archaeon]
MKKQLEIELSKIIDDFKEPKIKFEQYMTPPEIAAFMIHYAWMKGEIENKKIIDIGAGTGMLGIGAAFLGGNVTMIEIDKDAYEILKNNVAKTDHEIRLINKNIFDFDFDEKYDTALINPPFGIKSKNKDMDFIVKASKISKHIFSIHDGSESNINNIKSLFEKHNLKIIESLMMDFSLKSTYPWHEEKNKILKVMLLYSKVV